MIVVKLVMAQLVVILTAVLLICASYMLVLPNYFHDDRTYSVFIAGLLLTAISSAYVARRARLKAGMTGLVAVVAITVCVTATMLVVTLFILLNNRGA